MIALDPLSNRPLSRLAVGQARQGQVGGDDNEGRED